MLLKHCSFGRRINIPYKFIKTRVGVDNLYQINYYNYIFMLASEVKKEFLKDPEYRATFIEMEREIAWGIKQARKKRDKVGELIKVK